MKKRIVITGIGAISSLGKNIPEIMDNLTNSKTNYKKVPVKRFSTEHKVFLNNQAFMIDQGIYDHALENNPCIMPEVASTCIMEALKSTGMSIEKIQNNTTGLCLGISIGCSIPIVQRIKKAMKYHECDYELGLVSTPKIIGEIAKKFKIRGPVSAVSSACASGTNSIGRAFDLVENGKADIMIAGGIDIFTEFTYTGFNSLFALSKTKCKPFSKTRDGISIGDACGIVIMESLDSAIGRKAHIYAEVRGYHILSEAYHATAPHPEGKYALKCMEKALDCANISVDEIQYINAHGTGTPANDGAEFKACKCLLKEKKETTYIGFTKCMTGHTFGAAGSIEAIISILSIESNTLFGNYGAGDLPESENLSFITSNKNNVSIKNVLSNSFGFGGSMASIVLSNYNSKNLIIT